MDGNLHPNREIVALVVGDLIDEYQSSKKRVEDLISSEIDYPSERLTAADAKLASAFEALLKADLSSSHDVWIRTQFLLTEIRNHLDTGSLADKMAKVVEEDIFKMSQQI